MGRRLPPLNAVRAFEAAARHLSFTKAADELNVTQAAVSHQVKALEERLGVVLFRRLNRGLILTEAGASYLRELEDILDRLEQATERLRASEATGILTVSTGTSFASKWLVPRLQRFRDRRPDIDVRIDADDSLTDFRRDNVDLAIRYGRGVYPGLSSTKLLQDIVFPVCSPQLLEGPHPLREPSDLKHHTLLHDKDVVEDWLTWLRTAGVTDVDPSRGPTFSHSAMLIEAAIAGQGVALGRRSMVARDLREGRLVQPFPLSLEAQFCYWIVCPESSAEKPKIAEFRAWLLDEAASESREPARATA
jgi:LysR family transcriptional regulator, glycine cleavage system transcriptional activator